MAVAKAGVNTRSKPTTPVKAVGGSATNRVGGSPISPSNPIFKESGNDERGRVQNRIVDESSRFRGQMDPYINALGEGFGNAMESGNADYNSIMGGFGSMMGSPGIRARSIGYSDPFASYNDFKGLSQTGGYDIPNNDAYKGYKEFGDTGGYSANDIADLRSRGVAPIRAAYANAQQDVMRQRALQGGYSPNATAVLAKMAREQGQAGADALQATNAGIINSRNANRLSGFGGMAGIDQNRIGNQITGMKGMSDIENSRLNADLEVGKFNANAGMQADQWNMGNKLDALRGASSLYGTTPGMANMFASQLGDAIGRSGQQGSSYIAGETGAQQLDGRYENTNQYINDISTRAYPYIDQIAGLFKKKPTTQGTTLTPQQGGYTLPRF